MGDVNAEYYTSSMSFYDEEYFASNEWASNKPRSINDAGKADDLDLVSEADSLVSPTSGSDYHSNTSEWDSTDDEQPQAPEDIVSDKPPFLTKLQSAFILMCVFMAGVGLMLPYTCILASVTVYQCQYGSSIMTMISAAYYVPALPIFLLQAKLDTKYDLKYSARFAYTIRNSFALFGNSLMVVCLLLENQTWMLLTVAFLIGLFGSIGYGSFYQLLSLLPRINLSLFSMGLFSPTFFVLAFQLITGYGLPSKFGLVQQNKAEYFWIFATMLEIASLLVYLLLMRTEYIGYFCEKRDRAIAREQLAMGKHQKAVQASPSAGRFDAKMRFTRGADNAGIAPPLSGKDVILIIWPAMVAIFLSICASVTTTTLFAYVPYNKVVFLAVLLTYTKNFSDFAGRVLTLLPFKIESGWGVLFWGIFRGAMLPVFLIYTFADIFQSDVFICVFIAFISILSGYLNTTCYAWAAGAVPATSRPKAAGVMNICFQLSIYVSFGIQLVAVLLSPGANPDCSGTGGIHNSSSGGGGMMMMMS